MRPELYNGLTLAYIGDAIYEVFIRNYVLNSGLTKVNQLHKETTKYVTAPKQSYFIQNLLDNSMLTEEEINIYNRGRNSSPKTKRKNVDLKTYHDATGFEALIGYLYLMKRIDRLEEILKYLMTIGGEDNGGTN